MSTEQPTRRLRLTLGYHGTRYAGWGRQAVGRSGGRPTIQQALEECLADVLGHEVRVTAAGRTDAGVHAEGQVVSFDTSSRIPPEGLARTLRARLPPDIWPVQVSEVPGDFDARRCARRRWYRYAIWRGTAPPSAWQGRCLERTGPLDVGAMRRAAQCLLGRQDFAALVGGWSRDVRPGRTTTRTVYAADWLEPHGTGAALLLFEVCADAFLRQMVRTMVGSLLWVGEGRWQTSDLRAALDAACRSGAGPTAPAVGLTLWRIEY